MSTPPNMSEMSVTKVEAKKMWMAEEVLQFTAKKKIKIHVLINQQRNKGVKIRERWFSEKCSEIVNGSVKGFHPNN